MCHGALHQSLHGGGHSRVSTAFLHSPCRNSHGPNAPLPSARAYDASQAALGATAVRRGYDPLSVADEATHRAAMCEMLNVDDGDIVHAVLNAAVRAQCSVVRVREEELRCSQER